MEKTMTEARADALMEDGFHCSQCVFPYAAFRLGMDRDEALRLSAGLGGGCFHGDSCGAVTGAAMALSIVFGFDRPNAEEADKLLIEKVAEIAGKTPAFCTGDFNSNQQTNVYNTIVTSGTLVDSYARTTDKVNADWPSYNGYKYISTPPAKASRIDHIFVTKGRTKVQSWAIVNTSYSQKYPSDHFPVVIEWSFAK